MTRPVQSLAGGTGMRSVLRWLAPWLLLASFTVSGHGVEGQDAAFLERISGFHPFPFAYLSAKHMVTGYDHLLLLFGVVFFLASFKDVAKFVTVFHWPLHHADLCHLLQDHVELLPGGRHHRPERD